MDCLPVLQRELRVALRKQRPVARRLKVASLSIAGVVLLLFLFGSAYAEFGSFLHRLLYLLSLALILCTPGLTLDIFAEERRNDTLGLIFLSGLGAMEIFASKLLGAALIAANDLLAIAPLLALPFLLGGVSFDLFAVSLCSLPCLLLFVLAVCCLASVLSRSFTAAAVWAVGLSVLACATGPLGYLALSQHGAHPSRWWLCASPAFAVLQLESSNAVTPLPDLWHNLGLTLGWAGLFVVLAALVLKRVWLQQSDRQPCNGWQLAWQNWFHGSPAERRLTAAQWLDVNPAVWLAAVDRKPARLAWLAVASLVVLWLAGWGIFGRSWLCPGNFMLTAVALTLTVDRLIDHAAANLLAAGRHDGSYEMLLTTPLEPNQIVWGTLEGLREHFDKLLRAVVGIDLLLALAGVGLRPWDARSFAVYLGAWGLLVLWAWPGHARWRSTLPLLWAGLNCGWPIRAVRKQSGNPIFHWFMVISCGQVALSHLSTFPTGSAEEIVIGCFLLVLALLLAAARESLCLPYEFKLVAEFREIVREPLPARNDPRFKHWKIDERFPWGFGVSQHQLLERLARQLGPVPAMPRRDVVGYFLRRLKGTQP